MFYSILTSLLGQHSKVVLRYILPYGAIILLIVGVAWKAYNDGVDDTTEKYEVVIEEERHRIKEANSAALEEAHSQISQLRRELTQRNEQLLELQSEASEDPNADNPSLGLDSVRRINRIR